MPPKAKYTAEQIIDTAFDMVRESGMSALSARSLAKRMGTSTGPIFTAFDTIEEVQEEVVNRAKALYSKYLQEGLSQNPAFKGAGMKYIQFAKDEPELFKLLCMNGPIPEEITHFMPANDANAPLVLSVIQSSHGISEGEARKLYNHMSVYAHGLATLFALKRSVFTMEDVSRMLSEVFTAFIKENEEGDLR